MAKLSRVSPARRIVGDVLLALVILLTVSVVFVMTARINAVVLKGDYQKVFRYELIFCAVFLLLALDVRFSLFTRWKPVLLKGIGWILRAAVILCSAVILFFCGRVIVGSFINTEAPTDYAIVLGLALENGKPAPDLVSRVDTAKGWLEKNPEKEKWVLLAGFLFGWAAILYISLKPYPLTYREDGSLLVDPQRMMNDGYGDIGALIAFCAARFVEKKWIRFRPAGLNAKGCLVTAGGLAVLAAMLTWLRSPLDGLLGSHWGHFSFNVIVVFYIIALVPFLIKLICGSDDSAQGVKA